MIYHNDDTICAVSTPHGTGGIAVIRVSGPEAVSIVGKHWKGKDLATVRSHTAHYGEIVNPERSDDPLDQCVATVFRAPNSFTGEDTVELSVHGSRWIQREVTGLLVSGGCRLAERGEFTRRALMNGRIDLAQAEGIADVIASSSRASHRIAMRQMKGSISKKISSLRQSLVDISALIELELDFSEEDVEFVDRTQVAGLTLDILNELKALHATFRSGQAIKEGIPVAIAGPTNAGKSSLLNTLLHDERAIVSDIHGTTRDTIEECMEIDDYLFRFIDTAGLRQTDDKIEQIGIDRSYGAIEKARITVVLIDGTESIDNSLFNAIAEWKCDDIIIAINKTDLSDSENTAATVAKIKALTDNRFTIVDVSAKTGRNIDTLIHEILKIAKSAASDQNEIVITNIRQAAALEAGIKSTQRLYDAINGKITTDLLAQHLRETIDHLSTLTGSIPSTEILNQIFSTFCIGK